MNHSSIDPLVPTLCVGTEGPAARRRSRDAERRCLRSHAERGNEDALSQAVEDFEEAFDLGECIVVDEADAEHAFGFEAEGFGEIEGVVIAVPGEEPGATE